MSTLALLVAAASFCQGSPGSKIIDPVAHARMMRSLRALEPYRRAAKEALELHQFARALAATDAYASAAKGMNVPVSVTHLRAEALIGLGRSGEVLRTYSSRPQVKGLRDTYTLDLAQAILGKLSDERANQIRRSILAAYPGQPATILPPARSSAEKLALVRFVRAHVAQFSSRDSVFEYECNLALRANPHLSLLHYQMAEALSRMQRVSEARTHWQAASKLPGSLGERAKQVAAGYK